MGGIDVQVEALNMVKGQALLSDGGLVDITEYIDENGDDCEVDDAVAIVCGNDTVGWFSVLVKDYAPMTRH